MAELEPKPTAALAPKSVIITTGLGSLGCLGHKTVYQALVRQKGSMENYKWRNWVVNSINFLHAFFLVASLLVK